MPNSFWEIQKHNLTRLKEDGAVELLHDLIYAELVNESGRYASYSVPGQVKASDGGIDGYVKQSTFAAELVKSGDNYYQVKAGDETSLGEVGAVSLVTDKNGDLLPRIKEIAENNGSLTFFFPCMGKPHSDKAESYILDRVKQDLPDTTLAVTILQQDNIADLLNCYPALCIKYNETNSGPLQCFSQWKDSDDMSNTYVSQDSLTADIQTIRSLVLGSEQNEIRIIGSPGIGKTRLALESLDEPTISTLVMYTKNPRQLLDSGVIGQIKLSTVPIRGILVVDECEYSSRQLISNEMGSLKQGIKLVTIYNESEPGRSPYPLIEIGENSIEEATIKQIMRNSSLDANQTDRWAPMCVGFPRTAKLVAEAIASGLDDNWYNSPSVDNAMNLLLVNQGVSDINQLQKRKSVLSWLALFNKFGWETQPPTEREFIIEKIKQSTGLSDSEIKTIVKEFRNRHILQGETTLYISPMALHISAWTWWWDENGTDFNFQDFIKVTKQDGTTLQISDDMLRWFYDMWEYAHTSERAQHVIDEILSITGPLSNFEDFLEAVRNHFFLNLTKASAENALKLLSHHFGKITEKQLSQISASLRQDLVWSIQYMAVWNDLFVEAAQLLRKLVATETNYTYSNNSSGTFADLFTNAAGQVAPTEASPEHRFIVLKETMESKNTKEISAGIEAIDRALETRFFSRTVGPEYQGTKKLPKLWRPKDNDELTEAFKRPWDLLVKKLSSDALSDEHKEAAIKVINDQLRGLLSIKSLDSHVFSDYKDLVKKGLIPTNLATKTIVTILRYSKKEFTNELYREVEEFYDKTLVGTSFDSLLHRYVGTDIVEDWYGTGDHKDAPEKSKQRLIEIANTMLSKREKLEENVWLFTTEAVSAFRLGRTIAEIDHDHTLLSDLLRLQQISLDERDNPSTTFLGGYLHEVFRSNKDLWYKTIDEMLKSPAMKKYVTETIWRCGLEDKSSKIVLELFKSGVEQSAEFGIFKLGGELRDMTQSAFRDWIEWLIQKNDEPSYVTAVDFFHSYYAFEKDSPSMPEDLADKLLFNPLLLKLSERQVAREIDFDWVQIAKSYVKTFKDGALRVGNFILDNLGTRNTIFDDWYGEVNTLLNELVSSEPDKFWESIANALLKKDFANHDVSQWLRGNIGFGSRDEGALSMLGYEKVIKWVEKNPSERAPIIAGTIPNIFNSDQNIEGAEDFFIEFVSKFGNEKDVNNNILVNFWSEGYSGPASIHYLNKRNRARALMERTEDPKAKKWLINYIDSLQKEIDNSRVREERKGY